MSRRGAGSGLGSSGTVGGGSSLQHNGRAVDPYFDSRTVSLLNRIASKRRALHTRLAGAGEGWPTTKGSLAVGGGSSNTSGGGGGASAATAAAASAMANGSLLSRIAPTHAGGSSSASGVSAGSLAPTSQHVTPLTLLGSSAGASDGLLPSAVRPTAGGFTRSNSQASLRERADYVTAAFRHQQQPQQQQQQQQQVQHQQHNGAHEGSGGTARHHNHRRHGYHAHSRERHSGSVGASGGVRRPASASATRVQPASVRFSRRRSHAAAPSPSASSSTGNPSGGGHRRHHGLHGHSNRHDRAGGGSAGGSGLLAGGPGGGGGGGPGGDNMSLRGHRTSVGGRPASAGPEFTALGTSDTGHGHGHYHRLQSQQHDQHGRSMHRSNSSSGKNTRPTSAHPTASRGDSERQMTRPSSASGYPRNSMSRYNMQLEVNTAMQLGSGLPSPGSGAASMPGAAADLSFMPAGSGHRAARAAAGAAGAGAASGGGAQYNSSNSAPRSSGAGRRTPTAFGDPAVDAIEEDTSDGAATASAAATASDGGAGGHKATRGGRARGLVLNGGATGSPVTISAASPTTSKRGSTSLQTTANRGYNTRLPADGIVFAETPDLPGVPVVYRLPEARNQNPEQLNLDRRKLEVCPLLEGESRLRLLNYQNNVITRISNLHNLPHLIFLDLYNNRVTSIVNLDAVPALRVLMLGKNRITRIANLGSLHKLDVLDLHSNRITEVTGLNHLHELRVLNLAGNQIKSLDSLEGLSSLTELNLRRNRLETIAPNVHRALPVLQRLFLSNNNLPAFDPNMTSVFSMRTLVELAIDVNPIVANNLNSYRQTIINRIRSLKHLDLRRVTDDERRFADAEIRRAAEREREAERARRAAGAREVAIAAVVASWAEEFERVTGAPLSPVHLSEAEGDDGDGKSADVDASDGGKVGADEDEDDEDGEEEATTMVDSDAGDDSTDMESTAAHIAATAAAATSRVLYGAASGPGESPRSTMSRPGSAASARSSSGSEMAPSARATAGGAAQGSGGSGSGSGAGNNIAATGVTGISITSSRGGMARLRSGSGGWGTGPGEPGSSDGGAEGMGMAASNKPPRASMGSPRASTSSNAGRTTFGSMTKAESRGASRAPSPLGGARSRSPIQPRRSTRRRGDGRGDATRVFWELESCNDDRTLRMYGAAFSAFDEANVLRLATRVCFLYVSFDVVSDKALRCLSLLPRVKELQFSHNHLHSLRQLQALAARMPEAVRRLSVHHNSIAQNSRLFRPFVAHSMPHIKVLNGEPISAEDRAAAHRLFTPIARVLAAGNLTEGDEITRPGGGGGGGGAAGSRKSGGGAATTQAGAASSSSSASGPSSRRSRTRSRRTLVARASSRSLTRTASLRDSSSGGASGTDGTGRGSDADAPERAYGADLSRALRSATSSLHTSVSPEDATHIAAVGSVVQGIVEATVGHGCEVADTVQALNELWPDIMMQLVQDTVLDAAPWPAGASVAVPRYIDADLYRSRTSVSAVTDGGSGGSGGGGGGGGVGGGTRGSNSSRSSSRHHHHHHHHHHHRHHRSGGSGGERGHHRHHHRKRSTTSSSIASASSDKSHHRHHHHHHHRSRRSKDGDSQSTSGAGIGAGAGAGGGTGAGIRAAGAAAHAAAGTLQQQLELLLD